MGQSDPGREGEAGLNGRRLREAQQAQAERCRNRLALVLAPAFAITGPVFGIGDAFLSCNGRATALQCLIDGYGSIEAKVLPQVIDCCPTQSGDWLWRKQLPALGCEMPRSLSGQLLWPLVRRASPAARQAPNTADQGASPSGRPPGGSTL